MIFNRDARHRDIQTFPLLSERICVVVRNQKALVIHHLRHLKAYWGGGADHHLRACNKAHILEHSVLHLREHKWNSANTPLEQIRMVAHLPELHNEIHQILNLSLRGSKLE